MGKTSIEWTRGEDGSQGYTWNPVTGCSKVSAGCTNCYAEKVSHRFGWTNKPWNAAHAAENVQLHPERLEQPLRWRKPRRIFVNSMSDLFHEQVPFEFIEHVFTVMEEAEHHTFQVLTKRPHRMLEFMDWYRKRSCDDSVGLTWYPKKHIWLGVSVENQQAADERIPLLLLTPAAVRFLSCEPLLGPVSLDRWFGLQEGNQWTECLCNEINESDRPCITCECRKELGKKSGLDWIIVGGESGSHARPMHPDWARTLRDQCAEVGVPFFFKQWGEYIVPLDGLPACRVCGCTEHNACPDVCWWIEEDLCSNCEGLEAVPERPVEFGRVGKKAAGRILDGRTWDEFPRVGGETSGT